MNETLTLRNLNHDRPDVRKLVAQLIDLKQLLSNDSKYNQMEEAQRHLMDAFDIDIPSVENCNFDEDSVDHRIFLAKLLIERLPSNSPVHKSDLSFKIRDIQEAINILRTTYADVDTERTWTCITPLIISLYGYKQYQRYTKIFI